MKTALMVLQIIPSLIAAIASLESFLPKDGAGAQKLALLKTILTSSYDGLTEVWPAIEKIVAALVSTANSLGVFKKAE
jgi:hypothetical protein